MTWDVRMGAPSMPMGARDLSVEELPTKVLTADQANRLLPSIESVFHEMDHRSLRLREVLELITDLEEYWGERIADAGLPEHARYAALVGERDDIEATLQGDIERIQALGAVLKDYQQGLVDFYGRIEGRLVFLCWQRGEPKVRYYHTLESGFAGRRPLVAAPTE